MHADNVAVERGHFQRNADRVFVNDMRAYPRAEKRRVEVDHFFLKALPKRGHNKFRVGRMNAPHLINSSYAVQSRRDDRIIEILRIEFQPPKGVIDRFRL